MKYFDFIKIGSSSFDDIVIFSREDCVGLVVDDNEHILNSLPERSGVTKVRRAISFDGVEYIDDVGCHFSPIATVLKEQEVGEVMVFKVHLGVNSCKLLLGLFEYLEKENIGRLLSPKHISFEYTSEASSVDDLYSTLKKAVALGYSVDSQTPGRLFLNFTDY